MKILIIDNEGESAVKIGEQLIRIKQSGMYNGSSLSEDQVFLYQPSGSEPRIVSLAEVKRDEINDPIFKGYKEQVKIDVNNFIMCQESVVVLIDLVLNECVNSDYFKAEYYRNEEYSVELYAQILRYRINNPDKPVYVIMYSSSETGDITIAQVLQDILDKESGTENEKLPKAVCRIENISFFTRLKDRSAGIDINSPIHFEGSTINWLMRL